MIETGSLDVPACIRGDENVAGRWIAASEETYFARLRRPACSVNGALADFAARDAETPTAPAYWLWIGDNCGFDGAHRDSQSAYERAVDAAGRSAPLLESVDAARIARSSLASALRRNGDVEAAIEMSAGLFLEGGGSAEPAFEAARWAEESGRLDRAAELFAAAARARARDAAKPTKYAQLAERNLLRLSDMRTPRFQSAHAASEAVTDALAGRRSSRLEELLSHTHFSIGSICSHSRFEDETVRERLLSSLIDWRRLERGALEGAGKKRYSHVGVWDNELLRGDAVLMLTQFPDGWQWTGVAPTLPTDFWVDRWRPAKLETNQPLPFALSAPWPSDDRFMAGGLNEYIVKQSAIAAAAALAWPVGMIAAAALTLGFSLRACGFGIRGMYYNNFTHDEEDAFAIDFTRYKRGVAYKNQSGGTPVLATAAGVATVCRNDVASGDDSASNTVEIMHTDPSTGAPRYLSRYLHMTGPYQLSVSSLMFVSRGQKLGLMNDTGTSVVDHLHFSIHDQDNEYAGADFICGSTEDRYGHSVRPTPMDGQALGDGDSGKCIRSRTPYQGGPMSVSERTNRIGSQHFLRMPATDVGPDFELFIFTGIGVFDTLKGETGSDWVSGPATMDADYSNVIPAGSGIRVRHWTVDVHLGSIFNKNHAINTGWAVDEFSLPLLRDETGADFVAVNGQLAIQSQVAIRDSDAHVLRLSYNVAVLGEVAPFRIPPIE